MASLRVLFVCFAILVTIANAATFRQKRMAQRDRQTMKGEFETLELAIKEGHIMLSEYAKKELHGDVTLGSAKTKRMVETGFALSAPILVGKIPILDAHIRVDGERTTDTKQKKTEFAFFFVPPIVPVPGSKHEDKLVFSDKLKEDEAIAKAKEYLHKAEYPVVKEPPEESEEETVKEKTVNVKDLKVPLKKMVSGGDVEKITATLGAAAAAALLERRTSKKSHSHGTLQHETVQKATEKEAEEEARMGLRVQQMKNSMRTPPKAHKYFHSKQDGAKVTYTAVWSYIGADSKGVTRQVLVDDATGAVSPHRVLTFGKTGKAKTYIPLVDANGAPTPGATIFPDPAGAGDAGFEPFPVPLARYQHHGIIPPVKTTGADFDTLVLGRNDWISDTCTLQGNNVWVRYEQPNAVNPSTEGYYNAGTQTTYGGVDAATCTLDPQSAEEKRQVGLWLWFNYLHDLTYMFGWNEEMGNMQTIDHYPGGVAGDPLNVVLWNGQFGGVAQTDVLDDGEAIHMFFGTNLGFHSADDPTTFVHEYFHAILGRLAALPAPDGTPRFLHSGALYEAVSDIGAYCVIGMDVIGVGLGGNAISGIRIAGNGPVTVGAPAVLGGRRPLAPTNGVAGSAVVNTLDDFHVLGVDKYRIATMLVGVGVMAIRKWAPLLAAGLQNVGAPASVLMARSLMLHLVMLTAVYMGEDQTYMKFRWCMFHSLLAYWNGLRVGVVEPFLANFALGDALMIQLWNALDESFANYGMGYKFRPRKSPIGGEVGFFMTKDGFRFFQREVAAGDAAVIVYTYNPVVSVLAARNQISVAGDGVAMWCLQDSLDRGLY